MGGGSNPALATPEHGQQFYELAVKTEQPFGVLNSAIG